MKPETKRLRALLIDDTPVNLQVLTAALAADFNVQLATSGAVGLALAAKAPPDLILLDVMMPEMDGFEVCRRLKADPVLQTIPVIFLTALSAGASESVGLTLGADDYITKPINLEIAKLRIHNLMEREALRKEVSAQRDELQQALGSLERTSGLLQEARQRELEVGRSIQRSLLQGQTPQGLEGVSISVFSAPSQVVDGDFHDIRRLNANCFEIVVGDVMGKGVPAALIGAGVRTAYYQVLADLMSSGRWQAAPARPAQIVNQLHLLLTTRLTELACFVTLALYRVDLMTRTLCYVNAGHTPGLLKRAAQTGAVTLTGDNLPIGVEPAEVYAEQSVAIGPGDILALFSDGVTETRNEQGEQFGMQRLTALMARANIATDAALPDTVDAIIQSIQQFGAGQQVADDQTLLLVGLTPKARRNAAYET